MGLKYKEYIINVLKSISIHWSYFWTNNINIVLLVLKC
jgi:hypothetical protein